MANKGIPEPAARLLEAVQSLLEEETLDGIVNEVAEQTLSVIEEQLDKETPP